MILLLMLGGGMVAAGLCLMRRLSTMAHDLAVRRALATYWSPPSRSIVCRRRALVIRALAAAILITLGGAAIVCSLALQVIL